MADPCLTHSSITHCMTMTNNERIGIPAVQRYSFLFSKSTHNFTGNLNSEFLLVHQTASFPFRSRNPFPTSPGPHLHTPADTRPLRGEVAAVLPPSSPWSARISPVRQQTKCHKAAKRTEEGGPPAAEMPRPLTAGDVNSTKPSSGLHSAATKLPLARSREGASRSARAVPGLRPPGPARPGPAPLTGAPRAPPPAAATAPGDTGAAAPPGPPSRPGGSPWGHATAGAASGTASARRGAPRRWGEPGTRAQHRGHPARSRFPRTPRRPPGRAVPEHTPRGDLHGRGFGFGFGLHLAAVCGCARTAKPRPPRPSVRS